jgi:hypothetical protein
MQLLDVQRREQVLAAAVQQGRILPGGVPGYRLRYDSDPGGTERALAALQPVADDLRRREPDTEAALAEARALLPELRVRARRGRGRRAR